MLTQQYSKKFLKQEKDKSLDSLMDKIISKEEDLNKPCIDWNIDETEQFLKSLNSVSPISISRALAFLRNFTKYIGEVEGIEVPEFKLDHGRIPELIDYEKLMSTVLNYEQYIHIKNQLDTNPRDKLIFELAWSLLDSSEIKNLKESDIMFEEDDETGLEVAFLEVGRTDLVRIEDPEVVEDIKKCMKNNVKYEPNYYINTSDGKLKTLKFKYSDYLIKPVKVGRTKKEDFISNPLITLQGAIAQQDIICPGIEISEVSLASIKRSKIIYLLAPQNEKYIDKELIMVQLDSGSIEGNLNWLKKVAEKKYTVH